MRLPAHETGFDLANSLHPARTVTMPDLRRRQHHQDEPSRDGGGIRRQPEAIYDIILDTSTDEFIPASMCKALAMVTLRGELDRAVAGLFLRDASIDIRPQRECYVWVGWQSAIAALGMSDLKLLVKQAFDRGFIDSHILGFDYFEKDL